MEIIKNGYNKNWSPIIGHRSIVYGIEVQTSIIRVILVKSEQVDMLFQQIDVPNYMQTSDQNMIDNQFRFFENIRKISTLITNAGEKERLIFFANMRQKLQRLV